ncbi:phosphotransferase family protein [Actinoplanes sp. DH11]|uniref:phosphotransferase family protein n=1 Tax=Actinoplanes sp. DH11 TaxID=2857011 RepID=UPI001E507D9E|nr:phosphotransferase [Actinoplanes sp. DH11]
MQRTFLVPDDLHDLVRDHFGAARRLTSLDRLTGGSKKGVYRLRLDDATTTILYVWAAGENYWPPSPVVPDDPFTDASGAELFAVNHAALTDAGVRTPRLYALDRAGQFPGGDFALVEDVGARTLEALLADDPDAAAGPLTALGTAIRRMHTTPGPHYGKLTAVASGSASQRRRPEDVIVARALGHLDTAAARDDRIAAAQDRIADHVRELRGAVRPRQAYGLVHGELGPDHVFVTPSGEPVMIDFEGLAWFDVEWDHAWLRMRFGDAYPSLHPVDVDPARLALYRYAQTISLIEGPQRIATTDFPHRDWMLALAEWNITKALAELRPH